MPYRVSGITYHVSRSSYLVSRIGRASRKQPYRQPHATRYEPPDTITTAGFTLIEVMVTIGIFLLISLSTLLRFSNVGETQDARRAGVEFVSHAREMQRRTLSGSTAMDATPQLASPRGGFGVKISADGKSYSTVAYKNTIKKADDLTDDTGASSPHLSTIATYKFPNSNSTTIAPRRLVVVFTQPKGVLCVCNDSASCTAANTRCGLCREFDSVTPPICAVNPVDIPLTNAANQMVTFPVSVNGAVVSNIILDLVGARLTAE